MSCMSEFFGTRIRLLKHLSDRRRPECRDFLFSELKPPLSEEEVLRLDELDRVTRRQSRHAGLSYVPSTSQLVRNGKPSGICRS